MLEITWLHLQVHGYAVLPKGAISGDSSFRKHLSGDYFGTDVVRRRVPDNPPDRERARDVVRYEWTHGGLSLSENPEVHFENRSGFAGRRLYERFPSLADTHFQAWTRQALLLVPPPRRQRLGTVGINLLRTHTDVVTAPHRDQEEFVIIYVIAKNCSGGETQLFSNDGELVLSRDLQPGEVLIFDDSQFLHMSSKLRPRGSIEPSRDVIITTIDYPDSYGIGRYHSPDTISTLPILDIAGFDLELLRSRMNIARRSRNKAVI